MICLCKVVVDDLSGKIPRLTFLGLCACEHSQDQISALVGVWSRTTSFLSAIRQDMLRHM